MKIWELIHKLSKLEAGMDVYVTAYPDGTHNNLVGVVPDGDLVLLNGDGRYTDDLDPDQSGQE